MSEIRSSSGYINYNIVECGLISAVDIIIKA